MTGPNENENSDDPGSDAERERVERLLHARFRDPNQLPAHLPSPGLLQSVQREAHRQLRLGGGPVFHRKRIRDLSLAALMTSVAAVYLGWALTSVANLYR